MDLIRWKQDLLEDRNRLATLLAAAKQIDAARDAKLTALRDLIQRKCHDPINPGNRKIIVFTAFFRYGALSLCAARSLGQKHVGCRCCAGHRERRHTDHLARSAQRHERCAVGICAARQGAPGRTGR
ncbi:hypothetical protein [Pseudomonas aeruginosa]|uniref:hypothetical protein n=1 Tax=Pseudomonas aeruginosa TaxID=287 RepID=UPI001EF3D80A|nr:hypothetical protein [Pseudomonas aeruginosa]